MTNKWQLNMFWVGFLDLVFGWEERGKTAPATLTHDREKLESRNFEAGN